MVATILLQASQEIKSIIQEACSVMCLESAKALKDLGDAMVTMKKPCFADIHIRNSKAASENLNSLLKSSLWKETDLLSVLPAATVASLLIYIVSCTAEIADAVNEIPTLEEFGLVETAKPPSRPQCTPHGDNNSHVVILVEDSAPTNLPESKTLSDQHKTNKV